MGTMAPDPLKKADGVSRSEIGLFLFKEVSLALVLKCEGIAAGTMPSLAAWALFARWFPCAR